MNRLLVQRCEVKFCIELGKTARDPRHDQDCLATGRSSVSERNKLFQDGREQVEDEQRSARPSMAKSHDIAPSHTTFAVHGLVHHHGLVQTIQEVITKLKSILVCVPGSLQ